MPAYSAVAKLSQETGEYEFFFPLRAVGLGHEFEHKLALERKSALAGGPSGCERFWQVAADGGWSCSLCEKLPATLEAAGGSASAQVSFETLTFSSDGVAFAGRGEISNSAEMVSVR